MLYYNQNYILIVQGTEDKQLPSEMTFHPIKNLVQAIADPCHVSWLNPGKFVVQVQEGRIGDCGEWWSMVIWEGRNLKYMLEGREDLEMGASFISMEDLQTFNRCINILCFHGYSTMKLNSMTLSH